MHISALTVLSSIALAATSLGSVACTAPSDEETVEPRVELVDRTTQALASGALLWANGTYGANCRGRSALGTDAWSLRISGTATMTNAALSVTKGDSDCVLTLTKLQASALYDSSASIAMTAAYAVTPSSFTTGGGAIAFYANAKLSATDMAADFVMSILYSDDLASTTAASTATFAQYAGTSDAGPVPAPNYTGTNSVTIQANDNGTVASADGTLGLAAGSQTGESYRIIYGSVGATYIDVNTAYNSGTGSTAASVTTSIAASVFNLPGSALPASRTVIIQHLVSGVASYQVIRYTFNAPV